jgi:hypothetical protein
MANGTPGFARPFCMLLSSYYLRHRVALGGFLHAGKGGRETIPGRHAEFGKAGLSPAV